eukprot:Em0001g2132a
MQYISLINLLKASLAYAADSAEVSYTVASHVVRGDRCLKDYGFRLSQARVVLLSVSIQTGKYAGGTKMYFSFVRIWLVSTNKSITRVCDILMPGDLRLPTICDILTPGDLRLPTICDILMPGDLRLPKVCDILMAGDLRLPTVCDILMAGDQRLPTELIDRGYNCPAPVPSDNPM